LKRNDPPLTTDSIRTSRAVRPQPGWRLLKGLSGLFLIAAMLAGGHWLLRLESQYLPVRVVSIEGEVRQITLQQIQDTVGHTLDAGILTQDLASIQAAIRKLPWVSNAGVRRAWPDRLLISVQEHKPMARWGDDRLVTAEGIVFKPQPQEIPHSLPRLFGPADQAPQIATRFQQWQPLLKGQGLNIVSMEDDPRGAWSLTTDAGFILLLGKAEVDSRLARFLHAYPNILAAGRPARVDMRYSNGLAVSWSGARLAQRHHGSEHLVVQQESPPASHPGPPSDNESITPYGALAANQHPSRS